MLAVAPITNTTNVRLTTQPLTANTVYTLTVAGPAGALPPARFWGQDSFFVSQAFSARLHRAQVFYSLPVSASAQNTSLYTFTPALSATATSSGTGATFTLANDTDGLDVTFDVGGVTSSSGRMLASGHGGWVEFALSRPMNAALTPKVLLEGVDLSVNSEVLVSNDGRTLSVATGPLPSGRWQLTVCGLEDATGSARLGPTMVEAVVP